MNLKYPMCASPCMPLPLLAVSFSACSVDSVAPAAAFCGFVHITAEHVPLGMPSPSAYVTASDKTSVAPQVHLGIWLIAGLGASNYLNLRKQPHHSSFQMATAWGRVVHEIRAGQYMPLSDSCLLHLRLYRY